MIIQRGKEVLIKIWADEVESSAMGQLLTTLRPKEAKILVSYRLH